MADTHHASQQNAPEATADATAQRAKTQIIKRSIGIAGHRTSISLEEIFWLSLKDMAARQGRSIAGVVADIDAARGSANLSSAIRVFVLENALAPK